jgi:hypothetical protein
VDVNDMGFSVPKNNAVNPTEYSILYKKAFDIFGDEVLRLSQEGFVYAERGEKSIAQKYYRGANIYYYLMYVLIAAAEKQEILLALGETCPGALLNEQYKFDCIEDGLPCLSSHFDTDYGKAWEAMFTAFGIDNTRVCEDEGDCPCIGIGQMIINDDNDCEAFIVGPGQCAQIPEDLIGLGEFAPCEFPTEEIINGDFSNKTCTDKGESRNECNECD